MTFNWKESSPRYETVLSAFHTAFCDAYLDASNTENYPDDLPLWVRGWKIVFIAAKQPFIFLEYSPGAMGFAIGGFRWAGSAQIPELENMDKEDDIARVARIREIIAVRPFPFGAIPAQPDGAYVSQVATWAQDWGMSLAKEHMARTHPSFEEARTRMLEAYGVMFVLERTLRRWIEQTFSKKHGTDWWDGKKAKKGAVERDIERNRKDDRRYWVDSYDTSILQFAEFGHLKILIEANSNDFDPTWREDSWWLGPSLDTIGYLRNRIAHCNTLSADDFTIFHVETRKVLRVIAQLAPP